MRVYNFATRKSYRIPFPEKSYTAGLGANPEFDTTNIHINYTSLVTPLSVFEFNLATKERTLLKATEVPGGFDPANYCQRARRSDGDRRRESAHFHRLPQRARQGRQSAALPLQLRLLRIQHRAGFRSRRGSCSWTGASSTPWPTFAAAPIWAASGISNGKLMKKKNTFTDFIACADYLVEHKYGARDRLAIEGRSAGGLLIGAVLNFRPDLCKVAHLGVPFVDVINTMLDESLPLTVQEFLEWGNPKEAAAGRYMMEYSPYDNLAHAAYPSILVTTSLNDSQVLYHEPTKYVAKLRTLKTDNNPLILKCNMDAGHSGAQRPLQRAQRESLRRRLHADGNGHYQVTGRTPPARVNRLRVPRRGQSRQTPKRLPRSRCAGRECLARLPGPRPRIWRSQVRRRSCRDRP